MTSFPDITTSANSRRREQPTSTGKLSRVDEEGVQPIGWSPSPKRQKSKKRRSDEDDELAGDDGWDSEDVGFHREVYKPRPSRRRSNGANNDNNNARAAESATTNDNVIQDLPPTQDPHQPPGTTEEASREIPETPDIVAKAPTPAPDPASAMIDGKPPPKKRGRKKKQPPPPSDSDELAQARAPSGVSGADSGAVESEPTAASAAAAATDPYAFGDDIAPAEKPKKKRGRPRKSDTPVKPANKSPVRTEQNILPSTADPLAMYEEDFAPETAASRPPARRSESEEIPPSEEDGDEDDEPVVKKRGRKPAKRPKVSEPKETVAAPAARGSDSPLHEVDSNAKLPSPIAAAAAAEASGAETSTTAKKQAAEPAAASSATKKTTNPATPSQQRGKVAYRVGLSKNSRVTSLLKIIRK